MQYVITPYAERHEPFVWWEGEFSESELDWLQAKAKASENNAQVGGGAGGV